MKKQETQVKQVAKWLLRGRSITQLDALNLFGALRLSAIIHVLRHDFEMEIEMAREPNSENDGTHGRYYMTKDAIRDYMDGHKTRYDNFHDYDENEAM